MLLHFPENKMDFFVERTYPVILLPFLATKFIRDEIQIIVGLCQ